MSEVISLPLSDLVKEIIDNRGRTCPTSDQGIPLIATNCIKEDRIYPTHEKVRYVSDKTYREWFRSHPLPGDILFVNKGAPGRVCIVPDPIDFCIAQDMVALRANNNVVSPRYLFAALRSPQVKASIENMHVGTMIPHFKKGDFDKLLIPLPVREDQEQIGDLYWNFSLAIEKRYQTSETLKAMAKALFKSWFVDFDPVRAKAEDRPTGLPAEISDLFPNSFEDSQLGEIPSGWQMVPLGEIFDIEKGVSYKGDFLSDSEGLPMVNLGCFAGGGEFRAEKMKFYHGEYRKKHLVSSGDLLVANTDMTQKRIILGAPIVVPPWRGKDKFLFSHHTFAIRFKRSKSAFTRFVYFTLLRPAFRQVAAGHATGTTVLALPKDGIADYKTVIPPDDLLNVFSEKVEAFYEKCQSITEQIELLTETRDALLPKLVSGELRIPDAETLLEEVGV